MGDGIFLDDLDGGRLVIFKIGRPVPVGIEGDKLGLRVQQVRRRHRFFRNLIHAGQQVLQRGRPIRAGADFIYAVAIRRLHDEHGVRNGGAAVGVPFHYGQIGPLVVFQADRAVFSGEQLNMVFPGVQNMV